LPDQLREQPRSRRRSSKGLILIRNSHSFKSTWRGGAAVRPQLRGRPGSAVEVIWPDAEPERFRIRALGDDRRDVEPRDLDPAEHVLRFRRVLSGSNAGGPTNAALYKTAWAGSDSARRGPVARDCHRLFAKACRRLVDMPVSTTIWWSLTVTTVPEIIGCDEKW